MSNYISALFGKSPVFPLQQHMDACDECAKLLLPFFKAVIEEDWETVGQYRDQISKLEDDADQLKHKIRMGLPKSLFMPVPRGDVLELLLVQDKIANRTKDISGLVIGRRMQIPEEVGDKFLRYVERTIDAVIQARKTVRELDELFETGFRGAEVKLVESMILELGLIETDTDRLQLEIRNRLFEIESRYSPIDMIFLYQVIGLIGEVGDMAERTGRRLELMLSS
jgi:predicted phosphate transport protein (TIGR00153 family)